MKYAKLVISAAVAAAVSFSAAGQGFAEVRHGGGGGRNMNGNHNVNRNVNRNNNFNHNTNVNRNANINRNTNVNRNVNTNVNRNVNANVNRNVNVNGNYRHWNGGYYGNYHGGWNRTYGWYPGGAIAAGAAIGFVAAATAAAWAPPPPYPGLCWYYTDATQRNGFWIAARKRPDLQEAGAAEAAPRPPLQVALRQSLRPPDRAACADLGARHGLQGNSGLPRSLV